MKKSDWISVNDKLPTLGKRVLVCQTFNDGSMFVRAATLVKINGNYRWYDDDGRALGSWVYWWYEIYAHLSADLIYQEEEKEYETYDEALLEGIEYVINNLI